ncbi:MAG: HEAT repeat domain-containing protein [Gemmataceae bacterium]|nr:HEAT repeat domain-containing protein [Gemmataceae bacterium]
MAGPFIRSWAVRFGAASLLAVAGCAGWDEFSFKKMNFEVFTTPSEPMAVIRNPESSGALRARALRGVKEPAQHGGSQQEQDLYVQVLTHVAGHDPDPLCRHAAIGVLSKFKDARAVKGLQDAYYGASAFHAETASSLRRLALAGLGATGQEAAVELLVGVLREPPTEGAEQDREAKLQERLAAARALAHFKNTYRATTALAEAMGGKDADIALQRCCHESLEAITGQHPEQDALAWKRLLESPGAKDAIANRRPTMGEKLLELTGYNK